MNMKPAFLLAAGLALFAGHGLAQQLEPIPDPPAPPGLAGDGEPEITIRNRGTDRYEEYRVRGQLYMIKVTPMGGKPYYLVSRERGGAFERVDDLNRARMVTQWVLLSW
ncbi:MAG: DUF2782 domain-containing protein [Candidatus Dactylopiibacterium sp.]|nr:DUF2782 domain-containing protein [Candidatus Dactylopiibacterium sp.]